MDLKEKRMYFFVPYQLTGIQKGIQCGHAALEYAHKYGKTSEFIDFVENHKTWIVLNGGTTNNVLGQKGTLNNILDTLQEYNIKHASFFEPDLNNALTAICFIVDEIVFNYKTTTLMPDDENSINYKNWEQQQIESLGSKENFILFKLINGKPLATN